MINTFYNKTHQLLLFPPFFAAGSGSHALFSTSLFAEVVQAEKLLLSRHITALSTSKVFLQMAVQLFFCSILLRLFDAWKKVAQQGKTPFSRGF